jgi:hypothetical protein
MQAVDAYPDLIDCASLRIAFDEELADVMVKSSVASW